MLRNLVCLAAALLVSSVAFAEGKAPEKAEKGPKHLSGMSVVGNQESPKSLVIVPWKASSPGATLDVSRLPDDGRQPVDREVFMRELTYYQLRAASGRPDAVAAK